MSANSLSLIVAYLLFGLLASLLLRKGMPEDWGEGLLATLLGPPLFALIATAAIGNFVWQRFGVRPGHETQV
jgi:hypothetical protein